MCAKSVFVFHFSVSVCVTIDCVGSLAFVCNTLIFWACIGLCLCHYGSVDCPSLLNCMFHLIFRFSFIMVLYYVNFLYITACVSEPPCVF